jgi:DNA modification methylase
LTYESFLRSKMVVAPERGMPCDPSELSECLKPHQRDITAWAIQGGCRAIFAAFGLGKTLIQIQVLQYIIHKQGGYGLIVCPLGVKGEFVRDGLRFFGMDLVYVRTTEEFQQHRADGERYFVTNYERVRDGDIDPNVFTVVSLDEASVLRSFGSKTYQTFLGLFADVPFRFVATATPSPNRFKELIHYAGFLGVMDTGRALTMFFKRDSTKAGNLTLLETQERAFWTWVHSWAAFVQRPSDLGYSDEGYDLPPLEIHRHRLAVDHATAGFDSWGQGKLLRSAALGVQDASRERRDSLADRIAKAKEIIDAGAPDQHWIIWHDLEDERRAIEQAFSGYDIRTVYGSQDLEEREQFVADFTEGRYRILGTKPVLCGSGCNLQKYCHSAIYLGVGYKFNDFIQSIHRLQRFLQMHVVDVHLIYTESEDPIHDALMAKWEQHKHLVAQMTDIIREYGLGSHKLGTAAERSMGIERREERGERFTVVNNDCVLEARTMADASVDLIVTSIPFGNHYEYCDSYNDFGHNEDNGKFFEQMDWLTPELLRILQPGRMACVHVKDRIRYGSVTGLGMYSVDPFSDETVAHFRRHGFVYCGRITVVTDVVRENNQTYRLGWSEQCKDGTKMGVGSPEYVLLFRKLPTDTSTSYADVPVVKSKDEYTRARWQFDAHAHWRSNGDRFLRPEEIRELPMDTLRALWRQYNGTHVYNFKEHVSIAEALEQAGCLPASFMALDPVSHSPIVWDDVARMRTLNTEQARNRLEQHVCPLPLDIVERLIERYSNRGELVFDPFNGIGTVAYQAVLQGRRGYGCELNTDYWRDSIAYCRAAEQEIAMPTLFDLLGAEVADVA